MASSRPTMVLGHDFLARTTRLDGTLPKRVLIALQQFADDPDHPSLNLHSIKGDKSGRLHSIRVNDDVRILLSKQGNLYTALDTDHHDELYRRAERGRFLSNPSTGFIGFAEPSTESGTTESPAAQRHTGEELERCPFDHWTDVELRSIHLGDDEITLLRGCRDQNDVCDLWDQLDEETMELVFELCEKTPEEMAAQTLDPEAEAEERLRTAIAAHGAVNGLSQILTADELHKLASAPIEEWMVFLHPDQRAAVERRYEGPARVRGSAGTGKTVVALHRAVELAKRFSAEGGATRPILFTTYIKSLPPVFENLYRRLPGADEGAVEFVHIDKLAARICREEGERLRVDYRSVDAAFAKAWSQVVTAGSPLDQLGLTRQYLRDEISAVIKGRRIRTLGEYLGVERTGRRTRLLAPHREQVWELLEAWDREMTSRGSVDFPDVISCAAQLAEGRTEPTYRAAIIDEAQDLSLAGLHLVRALVNGGGDDPSDGLLIVGDGAQRIYTGGFTLRQAGVEVRGRTTVLRTNYRNTAEIIASAMAVAGDEPIDDLGDEQLRADADVDAERSGARPQYIACGSLSDQLVKVAREIQAIHDGDSDIGFGDIVVCAATNALVTKIASSFGRSQVPFVDLKNYDGKPAAKVKIGTFHRVKGLEFKVVFLIGLGAEEFPRSIPGADPVEQAESISMQISLLYVAMTRARDHLALLGSGEPTSVVADAGASFTITAT